MLTNMPAVLSEDRRTDNEKAFRLFHAVVEVGAGRIKTTNGGAAIHIKCECPDENCARHIALTSREYQKIRANRNAFIVLPGHQGNAIYAVLSKKARYTIIQESNPEH